ncbi:hypothetical protein M405DRAFT_930760 [Rhizopogon salebrosus TDB-379]|nr:hypothetical protein M405DRAFT_930760 [Rhizopogon salebrosus TDB-379]
MEIEYLSEPVTAARSLQTYTYMYASMVTVWAYDYTCSFNEEWTFLLESRWTMVKGLYIVTRYIQFLFFIGHLYMNFINETPDKCHMMNTILESISLISAICSECFFILRTYVLWNNNRIVLAVMLFSFFATIISSVSVLFATTIPTSFEISAIPGITGCYQRESIQLFIPFLLLFALELGVLILTLISAIQNWRATNSPLYTVLLKHNIEYYTIGLLFSGVNIFTSLYLRYAYSSLFHNFQLIILAILATRMHLYLWHLDQHMRDSDNLSFIHINISDGPGTLAMT